MSTIKIMLNNDEEIRKLAEDPEVRLRIKDAIVDGIAKRAIKEYDESLAKRVGEIVGEHFRSANYTSEDSAFYYRYNRELALTGKAERAVAEYFDTRILETVIDGIKEQVRPYREKLADMVKTRVSELEGLDMEKIVREEVARILERKLSK